MVLFSQLFINKRNRMKCISFQVKIIKAPQLLTFDSGKMTRQEQDALLRARAIYDHKTEPVPSIGFDAGFVAGLAYNQAKIDKLVAMLIAAGVNENLLNNVLNEIPSGREP